MSVRGSYRETHARSIAKAASWRVFGSVSTAGIVWVLTGRLAVSLAVGAVEFLVKIALFWMHERVWDGVTFGKRRIDPAVLWLTGLSGAGKTTIAQWVTAELRRRGFRVEHLDGDTVRDLFPRTGFTRADREDHVKRVGYLASRLEHHGVFVVASFISPDAAARDFVRALSMNFVEVHVATPLEECERRDPKGLYALARQGAIANFIGIHEPYEPPTDPALVIDTTHGRVDELGKAVMACLFSSLKRQRSAIRGSPRESEGIPATVSQS